MWLLPVPEGENGDEKIGISTLQPLLPSPPLLFLLLPECAPLLCFTLRIGLGSYSIVHKEQRGTVLLLTR